MKSAAAPRCVMIPEYDHEGEMPVGRLTKEEDLERDESESPLHSASPWPKRAA